MKPLVTCCLLLACLMLVPAAFAQAAPVLPTVYALFVGSWTGTLEYRDYQSNKRVTLPTILTVQPTPRGTALVFAYVYNDGPGKTVIETETVTIDAKSQTYSVLGSGDKKASVYQVAGLAAFTKAHRGTLILLGSGEDDNKKADFRKTITVTPKTLTILKEVRPPGSPFQFRNQYTFTRLPQPMPSNASARNQPVHISVPPISPTVRPAEYLLTPMVLPGSGPAWRRAQEKTLREATFRYLFKRFPPNQPVSVYYISVKANKDPDPALLKHFRGNTPPVRSVSALTDSSKDWNNEAKQQYVIYQVSSFRWINDTHMEIDAEFTESSLGDSAGLLLYCTLHSGRWEVTNIMRVSASIG